MKNKLIILLVSVMIFSGCKDLLSPADQNDRSLDVIYNSAPFAEGLLMNGYVRLPSGDYSFNDVATDNAVSNDGSNNYLLMATGKWSSLNNPMDQWANAFSAIQYLNMTLEQTDKVNWAISGLYTKEMFNDRTKGEAYGLRALFMYYLLQAHGGWTNDGKLMGVPIITKSLDTNSDVNLPRNTFAECLTQIYADLSQAESYLPLDFEDITTTSQLPGKYASKTTVSDYNRVFGAFDRGRLTSRIIKGFRAKVSLLAASPAFNQGTSVTWANAADDAAAVLDINGTGGISALATNGAKWYASSNAAEIDGLTQGVNPKEILWRTNVGASNNMESDNYPPTLYGKGRVNPTQNLVDAFPGVNGYPITDVTNSKYNPATPYAGRDPRLSLYIAVNGSKMGPGSTVVSTELGKTTDGLNAISTSTRTGYYLRKLLREDVNLNPSTTTTQKHYVARIRYTEIFLAYAEAANEAWGPDGTGTHAYSARNVIAAIRKRAGITQPDKYLATITTTEEMKNLIHNERRLELCFEGSRFWDLRRWKLDLTEAAKGMQITGTNYVVVPVENRVYKDYMYYGPIPNLEVLKFNNLVQNKGW